MTGSFVGPADFRQAEGLADHSPWQRPGTSCPHSTNLPWKGRTDVGDVGVLAFEGGQSIAHILIPRRRLRLWTLRSFRPWSPHAARRWRRGRGVRFNLRGLFARLDRLHYVGYNCGLAHSIRLPDRRIGWRVPHAAGMSTRTRRPRLSLSTRAADPNLGSP